MVVALEVNVFCRVDCLSDVDFVVCRVVVDDGLVVVLGGVAAVVKRDKMFFFFFFFVFFLFLFFCCFFFYSAIYCISIITLSSLNSFVVDTLFTISRQ